MANITHAIVRCMDGRLNEPLGRYLIEIGFPKVYDLLSLPGGARDFQDKQS